MIDKIEDSSICVLAGGQGSRISSQFPGIAKCLIPVAGKPFALHQIELLKSQGFKKFVFSIGHLGDQVREVLEDGSAFDISIEYVEDGNIPLGTGGAVKNILPILSDPFFVTYGDSYLRIDPQLMLDDFNQRGTNTLGSMAVLKNEDRWGDSNCRISDGFVTEYSKNGNADRFSYIDYGLSLYLKNSFHDVQSDRLDLGEITSRFANAGQLAAYEVFERFYEIGNPASLAETEQFLIGDK